MTTETTPASLIKPAYIAAAQRARRVFREHIAAGAPAERCASLHDTMRRRNDFVWEMGIYRRFAAEVGWTEKFMPRANNDHREYWVLRRGSREFITVHVDMQIEAIHAEVATGPVTIRKVQELHFLSWDKLEPLLDSTPAEDYPDTEWVLVVGPGYVEKRDYETASNYAEYRVAPGVYPVEIVDSSCRANPMPRVDGRQPYWAIATAPSVKFHEYYVNRLLHHSTVSESWEESPAVTHMRIYSFLLDPEHNPAPRELPADMDGKAVYIRRTDLPDALRAG